MKRFLIPGGVLTALLLLVVLSISYYYKTIHQLPRGIHEWAQADRYSLAIMFYDNGFNFFKPQTQNCSATDNVVGVEFPVQAWLSSVLAVLFGRNNLSLIFRIITNLMVITGLLALIKLAGIFIKDSVLAFLPSVFLFTCPVFVYYSGNYLPDAAAVAMCLVSFYFFTRLWYSGSTINLIGYAFFITLAVLMKTSLIIYWLGMALLYFGNFLKGRKQNSISTYLKVAFFQILSLLLIYLFYRHNVFLNNTYNSTIFNYKLWKHENDTAFDNFKIIKYIFFKRILNPDIWLFEYFLPIHYFILILSFVVLIILKYRRKRMSFSFLPFLVCCC